MSNEISILKWIIDKQIVTEKGEPLDFYDHSFLLDILTDWNKNLVVKACAQVGKSVTFTLKTLFAIKFLGFNIIYTFPTDDDVREFVSSKVNKILQANHHEFSGMDTDSIERKEINDRFIFFKGTVSKTSAISNSADLLVHDEASRSNQLMLETYKSRLKASEYKGRWLFSNPTTEKDLLDIEWRKSDQKEWCIICPHCKEEHHLVFPDSINLETKQYQCRLCKKEISDDVRRQGRWVAQNPGSEISGYHISHLIATKISAKEIIEDSEGDQEYFHNFVLGEPYNPGDLSVSRSTILDIWTPKSLITGDYFLGVDVGNIKHYILGSEKGIVKIGKFNKWSDLDDLIAFYKPKAGVIDAMPDNTMSKYYVEKYPFMKMSFFQENANNPQTIVWWGENERQGIVYSHRDRVLDKMLSDMVEAKFLIGVESNRDLLEYIKHFETLRRIKETNTKGIERYCFVAGTKIITDKGEKNIEDIKIDDKVLTRNGFKRVSNVMNRFSEVITKGNLCGTSNHPVFTNKGLQQLLSIPLYDKIYIWKTKKLYIKILHIIDTLMQKVFRTETILDQQKDIEKWVFKDYIKKFIKIILEQFQKALLFITKTIIHLIIHQITWGYYLKRNTINITLQSTIQTHYGQKKDLLKLEIKCLLDFINGKIPKKLKSFLVNTLKKLGIIKNGNVLFVKNVVKNLKPNIREEEHIVVKSVDKNGITDIITTKQKVYNLTIEETPEYFANGVLVHNCWESTTKVDHYVFATLYYWLALQGVGSGTYYKEALEGDKKSVISADNVYDISQAFREANYGDN